MRVVLAVVVVLILLAGGPLNPLSWFHAIPLLVAGAVLPKHVAFTAGTDRRAWVARCRICW